MAEAETMVFVIDDDAAMREALQSFLRSVGLSVETFASAREFLTGQRPDVPACLVLDVRLPGLSGLDLLDAISQALDRDRAAREQRAGLAGLRERYEQLTPREREGATAERGQVLKCALFS
jgi:FixJ family two-component response regulator